MEFSHAAPHLVRERVKILTECELACALGITEATLAQWRKNKNAPAHVKVGRRIFYHDVAVDQWLYDLLRVQMEEERNDVEPQENKLAKAPGSVSS
jgi:predicted DNA-binding transcriptional regulator AlpA